MSELRLTLLIAGLAALALLYVWEVIKRRRRSPGRQHGPGEGTDLSDFRISARTDEDVIAEGPVSVSGEPASRRQANPKPGPSASRTQDGPRESSTSNRQNILVLHILAGAGGEFSGEEIAAAAEQVGLLHGDMDIYHMHELEQDSGSAVLFSMADMFEPGQLPLERLSDFHTGGLTLFMHLSDSQHNVAVFEHMYTTARLLADELHGRLCGPNHGPIDDTGLAALRARAAEFD